MDRLSDLSGGFADIVEALAPSVVRVNAGRRRSGTGIVWSTDGVIITADHVVDHDDNLALGLNDGRTVPATVVGRDPTTDIALVRSTGTKLAPPTWLDPEHLRVGQLVLALGRPGRTVRAGLGIVSALGDSWRTSSGGQIDRYVQSDVGIYPGFSGGPLVDVAGKVLGLNTSGMPHRMTLTIPVPTLRRVAEALLTHGRVRRGYLGIGTQPVPLATGLRQQLRQDTGLLVVSVASGSSAERGGELQGDIIVTVDGAPIRHQDDLMPMLSGERVGTMLRVRIIRGGQIQELSILVGERD